MRKAFLLCLFALLGCLFVTQNAAAQQVQRAYVRAAHLSPNAPSVDITLTSTSEGGETLAPEALTNLNYETVTEYLDVPPGEYSLTVLSEGETVFEREVFFDPGVSYMVAAIGLVLPEEGAEPEEEEGGFFNFIQNLFSGDRDRDALALQLLVLQDNVDFVPIEGEPLVRLIHAAPGTEAVDLMGTGEGGERETVLSGINFGSVSAYSPLTEGLSEPAVTIAGSDALALELTEEDLEPGRVTTLIVTGTSLEQAPLKVITLSDEQRPVPSPLTGTGAGGTVASVAANNPDLATLTAALEQAGLLEVLEGPGPFTLFAPNEAAFAALPQDQLNALLADEEALQRVLNNHLVERIVTSFDIAGVGSLSSLEGAELEVVEAEDGSLSVAGGNVAVPDLEAGNGVVHVIDTVLLPADLEPTTESEGADQSEDPETEEAQMEEQTNAASEEMNAAEQTEEAVEVTAEEAQETTEEQAEEAEQEAQPANPTTLPPLQNTLVRVAHLSPNAPAVTITLTDTAEGGETFAPEDLSALSYETSTDYLEVARGEYTVSVTSDGDPMLEQTMFLDPGINYTLAVVGLVLPEEDTEAEEDEGGFFGFIQNLFSGDRDRDALALQLLPLQDNVEFIAGEGETMLRLVHAAPGTDALELRVNREGERETLVDAADFASVSGYAGLSGNALDPAITIAGSDALTLELSDVAFEPNSVTTLFVTGTSLEQAPLKVVALSGEPRPIPTALPATAVGGTVASIVFGDPDLITLSTALEQAGMLEVLDGPGPFTLFAPNTAAFAALPQDQLDTLLADPEALMQVLNNHVVNSVVMSSDVADAGMLTTLDGVNLEVAADADGNLSVGDGIIVIPDIQASNGVVHIIDTVLLPEDLALTQDAEDGEGN